MTAASEEPAPSKADQYNAVVDKARLLHVMLTNSVFHCANDFRNKEPDAAKFIDEGCHNITTVDAENMLLGQVRFRVWMVEQGVEVPKGISGDDAFKMGAVQLEANYVVAFNVPGSHEGEHLTAFFQRTAAFTAWPYFRALVAQFGAAAEVDIPILPIKQLSVPLRTGAEYTSSRSEAAKE